MKKSADKPFFVGYLEMPAKLAKFYVPLSLLLIGFTGFVGYSIAALQKPTGPAVWITDSVETIEGIISVDPYPVLHRIDPTNPDQLESILLVQQGKYSADEISLKYHNQPVKVSGFKVQRGGWTMLELRSGDDIQPAAAQTGEDTTSTLSNKSVVVDLGPITLTGEILDSKCFLGVMKPGAGLVHKACAEVCLIGGIPTMLLVRGKDQRKYGYILTNPDGTSVSKKIAYKAADLVEVSGNLEQKGDLLYLKMSNKI